MIVKLIAGLFGIVVVMNVVNGLNGGSSTQTSSASVADPKQQALNSVKLEKWGWNKGGFSSIMMLNGTIKNDGVRDVKDITIECKHSSNSGTEIDRNSKVVYELVKVGKSINIKEFNMGFIHSQAATTSCNITDLVIL